MEQTGSRAEAPGFYLTLRHFEQARELSQRRVSIGKAQDQEMALELDGSTFFVDLRWTPAADGGLEGRVSAELRSGSGLSYTLAVEMDLADWSRENYLLIPAAVYGGNRFAVRQQAYPPLAPAEDRVLDAPLTISDVPHLEQGGGVSRIQLNSGDMATPALGIFCPVQKQALILLTQDRCELGLLGLQLRESEDRRTCTLTLEAPGVRTEGMYHNMNSRHPTIDRAADWPAGKRIDFRFRLYEFAAESVQGLFDRFAHLRQALSGTPPVKSEIPFSAAWELVENKYNRDNWRQEGYYAVGTPGTGLYQDWQLGWVGGAMNTLPLLAVGTAESRRRATQTLDWMFSQAQRHSGLIAGIISGGKSIGDGFTQPGTQNWVMTRRQADGLYFVLKHIYLLESLSALPVPLLWREGAMRLADCLCAIWGEYGQLGQFLNDQTGKIVVGNSTAGAIAPAGLALAGAYFHRPEYVQVAGQIAEQFYQRDTRAGLSTGGPGEILNAPDSESAFALLESYVVLWEQTQKPLWLDRAGQMARQCCTWVHSYDFRFPPQSPFGKLDMRSNGSVWANVQNKHSAPGICTLSGDSLLKLYRATGDRWYLQLCRDIVHGTPQYFSRTDRPIQDLPDGWMCERVNTCDWEYNWCPPGHVFRGSCWCEVSFMLSYIEVPGVYVDLDAGAATCIDHVEAVVLGRAGRGVRLKLTNPTQFEARVRLLAEGAKQRARPLGQLSFANWPVVSVPAGGSVEYVAG